MLRRKADTPLPDDLIDQELVEGVEAELPWRVLLQSARCPPDEAEGRLLRLLMSGYLEGTPGDDPQRRVSIAPRMADPIVRPSLRPRPNLSSAPPPQPRSQPATTSARGQSNVPAAARMAQPPRPSESEWPLPLEEDLG